MVAACSAPDVEAILERRHDPSQALRSLLGHLSAALPPGAPQSASPENLEPLELHRRAHQLLEEASVLGGGDALLVVGRLLELPDHPARLRSLLLAPATYGSPAVVDQLLAAAASRRASEPSSALALAELALVAATLLPGAPPSARAAFLLRTHLLDAELHRALGRHPAAHQALETAHSLLELAADPLLAAQYHCQAASLAIDRRRLAAALRHLDQADADARASGSAEAVARALRLRACLASHRHELTHALAILRRAHDQLDPEESPGLYLAVQHHRCLLLLETGALAHARSLYASVAHLYGGTPCCRLRHLWLLGRFAHAAGDTEAALGHLRAAHRLAGELGHDFDRALLDLELAVLALERRDFDLAARDAHRSLSVLALLDLPQEATGALLVLTTALASRPLTLTAAPLRAVLRALRYTFPLATRPPALPPD